MLALITRNAAIHKYGLVLEKNATLYGPTVKPGNLCWHLWGCRSCGAVSLTLFGFICLWMSAHTYHRATEDFIPLSSQAKLRESVSSTYVSELEGWAIGCDTATKDLSLFYFCWWFSVGWCIISSTSAHSGIIYLLFASYRVTHNIALLDLCCHRLRIIRTTLTSPPSVPRSRWAEDNAVFFSLKSRNKQFPRVGQGITSICGAFKSRSLHCHGDVEELEWSVRNKMI